MTLCKVYYRAKNLAVNNGRTYHVVAILKRRGRIIKIGVNSDKTHPRFKRQYSDGTWASHMHAEMNVLRFAQPGDEIEVLRFTKKDQKRTMAKPCELCQKELHKAGIKKVRYTNWDGDWECLHIDKINEKKN